MERKYKPIRMCVNCRLRFAQSEMIRLQKNGSDVVVYSGAGRSFYICEKCLESSKFLVKKVCGIIKIDEEKFSKLLKEFKSNV